MPRPSRAAASGSRAPLRPFAPLPRLFRFAVAAYPPHRLHIVPRGFRIVPLLLGSAEHRVVAPALLFKHAPRVLPAVNRTEALTGSAVFPLGFATPIGRRCTARDARAETHGKHRQGMPIPADRIVSCHVMVSILCRGRRPRQESRPGLREHGIASPSGKQIRHARSFRHWERRRSTPARRAFRRSVAPD